jgi:hypothetical protein
MKKKLMSILVAMIIAVGVFTFNAGNNKAYAATIAGTDQCTAIAGHIGTNNPSSFGWKYSAATCWNWPQYGVISFHFYNASGTYGFGGDDCLLYLDRWDGYQWLEVAHTGNADDGRRLNTTLGQGDGDPTVTFTREYSGGISDTARYRMRWSCPNSRDAATTYYLEY